VASETVVWLDLTDPDPLSYVRSTHLNVPNLFGLQQTVCRSYRTDSETVSCVRCRVICNVELLNTVEKLEHQTNLGLMVKLSIAP